MHPQVAETEEAVADELNKWADDPSIAIEQSGDEIWAERNELLQQITGLICLTVLELKEE